MKKATGSLAILGSGETSPNLVSVHRELLHGLDDSSDVLMIDSPFGFQENASQLVKKIIDFYKVSLNVDMKLLLTEKLKNYIQNHSLNQFNYWKMLHLFLLDLEALAMQASFGSVMSFKKL